MSAINQKADIIASTMSARLFPNRDRLSPKELAKAWFCSVGHVIKLINQGELGAIETGIGAKTNPAHWKIPVEAYDDFVRRRTIVSPQERKKRGKAGAHKK